MSRYYRFKHIIKKYVIACSLCICYTYCHPPTSPIGSRSNHTNNHSENVRLGQYLFYDTRLSANNTKSCATCHDPKWAFTDGYRRSTGIYGDNTPHNSPSLLNLQHFESLNWATPHIRDLADQIIRPLMDTVPLEMGAKGNEQLIYERLAADTCYQKLFEQAYPKVKSPIHFDNIIASLSEFVASLESRNSCYDSCRQQLECRLSPDAIAGKYLFEGKAYCSTCHGGIDFNQAQTGSSYANVGLYYCNEGYPQYDFGIAQTTHRKDDNGKYRIPSLRNVALSSPYFHDGSVSTLGEVIDIYNRGGRAVHFGDCMGDGRDNPNRDQRLKPISLTEIEKQQLLAFLHSLTDTSYLQNPRFTNPF